jgi:NAD(P)-dependent dehydrogenase (short-subunit alcohol dehydrogenase family)
MTTKLAKLFSGKRVLISGGLGFIGSNLARRLLQYGASVTIIDNLSPGFGEFMTPVYNLPISLGGFAYHLRCEVLPKEFNHKLAFPENRMMFAMR